MERSDKQRVLVVDDDREIVAAIVRLLEREGIEAIPAYNGREAVERLTENEIHLIIIDIMMPEMDGISATIKIRTERNIPVIMLSAKTEESDKILGLSVGADDYVTKPFSPAELIARVKSQLRRYMTLGDYANRSGGSDVALGGLLLHRDQRQLDVDGEPVKLTPKEYRIVELLMSNPGRVFSAEEIYERVWNETAYSVENTIMVHIRRIREKIEIIQTKPRYLKVVWELDTRLKNSKTRSGIYAAVFITEVIAACALTVAATIFSALGTMSWAKDISPDDWHFYTGNIIDQSKYDQLQNNIGIWGMLAILLVAGLLILLAFMTGKGKLNDDGSVHLTWFDKMWSELQIIVASLAGVWAGSITVVLYEIWLRGDYLGVWESTGGEDSYFSGPLTKEIGMTYCMVGLVVSVSMFLLCFLSLLKKIKTKQFWEKSLLGGAFLAIYRSIKGSDKTLLKVIIILMAGAILSATWILLPVMLVLILIFVPKQVKKFTAIKEGIEEVKSGNLSYKIPVEEDAKGIKGEFDRMARG